MRSFENQMFCPFVIIIYEKKYALYLEKRNVKLSHFLLLFLQLLIILKKSALFFVWLLRKCRKRRESEEL